MRWRPRPPAAPEVPRLPGPARLQHHAAAAGGYGSAAAKRVRHQSPGRLPPTLGGSAGLSGPAPAAPAAMVGRRMICAAAP